MKACVGVTVTVIQHESEYYTKKHFGGVATQTLGATQKVVHKT